MSILTIYDLCGEDHSVFANREQNDDITIEIWNDKDIEVYKQTSHRFAWESLVSFANMVLDQDKKLGDTHG